MKKNNGFTLIEMVISVAIVAVLAMVLLKTFAISAQVQRKTVDGYRAQVAAQNMVEYFKTVDNYAEEFDDLGLLKKDKYDEQGKLKEKGQLYNEQKFLDCWKALESENNRLFGKLTEADKESLEGVKVTVKRDEVDIPTISRTISPLWVNSEKLADSDAMYYIARENFMTALNGEYEPSKLKITRTIKLYFGLAKDGDGVICEDITGFKSKIEKTYTFEYDNVKIAEEPELPIPISGIKTSKYGYDATYVFINPLPLEAQGVRTETKISAMIETPDFSNPHDASLLGAVYICVQDPKQTGTVQQPEVDRSQINFKIINASSMAGEDSDFKSVLEQTNKDDLSSRQNIVKYTMKISFPNKPGKSSSGESADIVAEFTD